MSEDVKGNEELFYLLLDKKKARVGRTKDVDPERAHDSLSEQTKPEHSLTPAGTLCREPRSRLVQESGGGGPDDQARPVETSSPSVSDVQTKTRSKLSPSCPD